MGRKYYCEYCDKRIQNDFRIIKQHNEGLFHIRSKAEHFEQFKELEQTLQEIKNKKPCRTFEDGNLCIFGVLCRFRHYTAEQMWEMQQLVDFTKHQRYKKTERLLKYMRNVKTRTDIFLRKRFHQSYYESQKIPPSMYMMRTSHNKIDSDL